MKCPQCQHDNPPQSSFCLECGARLTLTCGSCGADLPLGSKFCNNCGNPVQPSAVSRPRFASPDAYTPKHLAEKILTSKSALENGNNDLVLHTFGPVQILTSRSARRRAQAGNRAVRRPQGLDGAPRRPGSRGGAETPRSGPGADDGGRPSLRGHGESLMGDGIMALFGAPVAHEDHAVRACYAALRMQQSINLYADELQRGGGTPVQIRVGLNSGEVVVRAIGSDLHMDYTAVGADDPSRRPDGTDGQARVRPGHRRHPEAGRRVRPGETARAGHREGTREPD